MDWVLSFSFLYIENLNRGQSFFVRVVVFCGRSFAPMIGALEEMWNGLPLTEEEQAEVVVEKEWVEDLSEVGNKCLLGKLLLKRAINIEAIRNVSLKIWKITFGMTIREVEDRLFLLYFEDGLERDRVFQRQSWSFNNSLLVLK